MGKKLSSIRLGVLGGTLWTILSIWLFYFRGDNGVYDWAFLNGTTAGMFALILDDLWLACLAATVFNAMLFGGAVFLLVSIIKRSSKFGPNADSEAR